MKPSHPRRSWFAVWRWKWWVWVVVVAPTIIAGYMLTLPVVDAFVNNPSPRVPQEVRQIYFAPGIWLHENSPSYRHFYYHAYYDSLDTMLDLKIIAD